MAVGTEERDPVTGADAQGAEAASQAAGALCKLPVGKAPLIANHRDVGGELFCSVTQTTKGRERDVQAFFLLWQDG